MTRRVVALAAIVVALAVLAVVGMFVTSRPTSSPRTLEARVIRLTPDPKALMVGVAWSEDGYCVGELTVSANETDAEVFVGAVTDDRTGDACAGVGTTYDTAYADLMLRSPLGSRRVIRSRDGKALPILADADRFIPKHPTAADIGQYGGANDSPAFGLKKQAHITDPATLEDLAQRLDSLPPFPAGTIFCPFDDGSYFLIRLTYGAGSLDYPVKIDARGCQGVYLLGVNRPAAWAGGTSPSIVETLTQVVQT